MSQLFSPYQLGALHLKNRIVIAPMCQYACVDGQANAWHHTHLGHLALSDAALLIIEATAVTPEGRITPADLGLWSDETEAALKSVLAAVRQHSDMPIGIQLAHAGRKASCHVPWQEGGAQIAPTAPNGWQTLAPSAIAFRPADQAPTALDAAGMEHIKAGFVATAQRAHSLGLQLIELHGAHGYLLHEFLSPLSNQRTDAYGGSLENRMRFPLEVFRAVRAAVPANVVVGLRLSGADWVPGGWDAAQSVVFGQALRDAGCDYLHMSSGGMSPAQQIVLGPGYQVPLAEQIKREVGLPTMAVGLITEAQQAEDILVQGQADLVALARGMLYNPRWPWHAAAQLGAQVAVPPQYLRSAPSGTRGLFGNA